MACTIHTVDLDVAKEVQAYGGALQPMGHPHFRAELGGALSFDGI
eukprot:CAMPEP_0115886958 /NCGR_PEP_ID=MMETSP0287-20121206/31498_1 /TAXON_ID=412157 /ORGANISM="Chrysochromulina rotalis, Strain UIO044" /LENGTH=44 /DNA_ID= /DNA_START= /DNA_END= /DNA_ORIENTATION=